MKSHDPKISDVNEQSDLPASRLNKLSLDRLFTLHTGDMIDIVRFWTDNRPMEYLTVSTAKPKLGRLLDNVLKKGSPVVIRRGNRFVQLSEYILPDPIPERPPGYFATAESPAEYERANRLASLSSDRPE